MDPRLRHLAERQHGLVARRQLLDAGMAPAAVDASVLHGRLRRVERGVYAVLGVPTGPAQRLLAAVLRAGRGARAVGPALLGLLGLRGRSPDERFVVLVPPGREVTGVAFPCRASAHLAMLPRVRVHGVPSTSLAGNVLEAARDVGPGELEQLVDAVRWRGGDHLARLRRLSAELRTHDGARALRRSGLLDEAAPESPPERRLLDLLEHLAPESQVWVAPDVRVDVLVRQLGLAVEYDGPTHRGRPNRERDATRDARIRAAGFGVVHLTAADLRDPATLLARLARAARAR